ncbi:hypothetical protein N0V93_007118 [Gnomoniopsis smithogilvyi]|uniref:Ubiquitin-like domain-containing protein n=1 Tax=Gnomoniopsis smithogilvyi TaxID=1191159 RepID=A0A9W9CW92_9PEZI|nr:hypothetical protein N0V93_007118 [Gnomoniopsis smithogilvyi]
MATPGFGFSVGDVLAGLHVVRKLIRALNDTAGSRAAYQKLISELLNLEDALTGVKDLQVDPAQAAQKLALEQVARQCQGSIERFLTKNAKFKDSLGVRPSSMSAWRSRLHKVQWALCKESEIEGLRTEIATHSTTLNLILSTIQLSATKIQGEAIDGCAQLAKVARDDNNQTGTLVKKNNEMLTTQAELIATISSTVVNLSSRQQTTGLQDLVQKVLESNMRIFSTVIQTQQLQASLPPQIERQRPIIFEDAHERLTPFHVEFINSFAAFQAVLEVRFRQVPGLKKVKGLEYAVQDTASKKALDLSKPWESLFRPGRKVVMSMLFQQVESTISSCPGCLRENIMEDDDEDTHMQCSNPACGLWYRRVTEVRSAKRSWAEQQDRGATKKRKLNSRVLVNNEPEEDSDDEDEIRDFRRVQIVQENRKQTMSPTPVPFENHSSAQWISGQSTTFLPQLEQNFLKDFRCCEKTWNSMHELLQHYEETHSLELSPSTTQSQAVKSALFGRGLVDDGVAAHEALNGFDQYLDRYNQDGTESEMGPAQAQQLGDGYLAEPDLPSLQPDVSLQIPKLERTIVDIFSDQLYNSALETDAIKSSRPDHVSLPPLGDLFAQRVRAANDQHLRADQPPQRTPFRGGSPLAPPRGWSSIRETNSRYNPSQVMMEAAKQSIRTFENVASLEPDDMPPPPLPPPRFVSPEDIPLYVNGIE